VPAELRVQCIASFVPSDFDNGGISGPGGQDQRVVYAGRLIACRGARVFAVHRDEPSAASCPQAPSMSRPRVSRTVVGMPLASRRRTNSLSSSCREAVHLEPGVGFKGIKFTCTHPQSPT